MTTIEPSYARPRSIYPRLALLAVGLFLVGTNAFVIAGLLPDIARTFGDTPSTVSYSITYYAVTVAIAAPLVSILASRLSRTTLMASGLVLIAIGTAFAAASSTLTLFTVGRIIAALGGAALVPAATAAAAAIAPIEKRGRAIAFVAIGFTLASAVGSPLGTGLGAIGGWELPLYLIAGLAALLAVAVALFVRDLPIGAAISLGRRFAALRDHRLLMVLVSSLLVFAGFNIVYIFSSAVTERATGGSGTLLAALLLLYGIGGVVGNAISGFVTDRLGSRPAAVIFLVIQVALMIALPFLSGSFPATAIIFVLWGLAAFACGTPIQHRLVSIEPEAAALSLSWYTTAMYLGISIAPLLGAAAIGAGGAQTVPLVGGAAVLLSLVAFLLGYVSRTRSADVVEKREQPA